MKKNSNSKNISAVVDVLEKIEDVNNLLERHRYDEDNLMLNQFPYRKGIFLHDLQGLLENVQ